MLALPKQVCSRKQKLHFLRQEVQKASQVALANAKYLVADLEQQLKEAQAAILESERKLESIGFEKVMAENAFEAEVQKSPESDDAADTGMDTGSHKDSDVRSPTNEVQSASGMRIDQEYPEFWEFEQEQDQGEHSGDVESNNSPTKRAAAQAQSIAKKSRMDSEFAFKPEDFQKLANVSPGSADFEDLRCAFQCIKSKLNKSKGEPYTQNPMDSQRLAEVRAAAEAGASAARNVDTTAGG